MRSKINIEDIDVLKMFVEEWKKYLNGLDKEIVMLEFKIEDIELLNHILVSIHKIKGGASFIGLPYITRICYEMEMALDVISHMKLAENTEIIDSLLLCVDYLKAFSVVFYERIKQYDFTEENSSSIQEFENEKKDDQVLESIIHAREQVTKLDHCNTEENAGDELQGETGSEDELIEEISSEVLLDNNLQTVPIITQQTSAITQQAPTIAQQEIFKADEMKSKNNITQSIRVNQDKLDKMMNMISELIIAKNSFMHISTKLNKEYDLPEISKEVKQVGAYVNRISDELQNAIMSIRMIEIKTIFQKMPRVIRDISQSSGKKMELFLEGESTEIDKTIIEQISDPLIHLIRNAADHGIENPQERYAKGKPETGRIVLRAYNKNKHVIIEIEDDGKGIDAEKLKIKAIEKGILSEKEAENMNKSQLINLIFLPGFSMAKQITEVSGRGVGMDIVKSNISKINGTVTIESEIDKGTKMLIQLPLTLAVSRGLNVEVSKNTYIIPLEYIVETVKIKRKDLHLYNEKYFTHLREQAIAVEWLSKIFLTGERDLEKEEISAVILSCGGENFAIVVDKLNNEQEFVVKTLEGHLASIPGISGTTLLGNGQVVLIVNPADLMELADQ